MTADPLHYILLFLAGVSVALFVWLLYRQGSENRIMHRLADSLDTWRSESSEANSKTLAASKQQAHETSRFLEETEKSHEAILQTFTEIARSMHAQIDKAEQTVRLNSQALDEAVAQRKALERLISLRTPQLQTIPTKPSNPAAPTSYDEVDEDQPVTWAQIRAAGELKRKREEARRAELREQAQRLQEEQRASQEPPVPEPNSETPAAVFDEVEPSPGSRFSAFDDVLRRAHKESNE